MFKKIVLAVSMAGIPFGIAAEVTTSRGFTLLTTAQVTECRKSLAREMAVRAYIKPATIAAIIGVIAYQRGWFDYAWQKGQEQFGVKTEVIPVVAAATSAATAPVEFVTKEEFTALKKIIEASTSKGILGQSWEIMKSITLWSTVGLATDLIIPSSLRTWFVKPDFNWMYKQRARIFTLLEDASYNANEYAKKITSNPERSSYHKDNLVINIKNLIPGMKYLLAYIEYRFDQVPQNVLAQQGLPVLPAYLLKTTNEFLNDCNDALDLDDIAKVVELIKDFKGEIINSYTRCTALD